MADPDRLLTILSEAKKLAQEYHRLTGKSLGITGEVAEYEAATKLVGLKLTGARKASYDAVETKDGVSRTVQIKGRRILDKCKRSEMIGSIRIDKDWDAVLLVLMDDDFNAIEIWEADRAAIVAALTAPGSKARNKRGALAVSKFKAISLNGLPVWKRPAS